jgi:dTDP-glucose 4,6-dehydratase
VPGPVDLVLHFASPASPIDYLRLPLQTLKVGGIGTWHALGLAKEKAARFVLASTSEVYGDPQVHPQPEDYWGHVNPVGPRGVYDEAKRYGEALTMAYQRSEGLDTAIVRLFNTYGPRMRPADGRAIPTFIRQALAGEPVTVAGDGRQTRSVCYIDDTVAGILALAASGEPGPVNIGNPDERSVLQIAQDVIAAVGSRSEVTFIQRPVDDPAVRRPDTALARERLGWQPRVSWTDGLADTVAWFRGALAATA